MPGFDVFVSYSHTDRAWVETRLVAALDSAGLVVAVDFRAFGTGSPVVFNMEEALRDSRKVVLVLTPDWLGGQWTRWEFLIAQVTDPLNRARRILPILLRPCDLPPSLRVLTYQDMSGGDGDGGIQIQRLVAAIREDVPPAILSTAPKRHDGRFDLDRGLHRMSGLIRSAGAEADYLDFLVLEARLRGNLDDERRFGSHEGFRSDRARIVLELNRIALKSLAKTFNQLCLDG